MLEPRPNLGALFLSVLLATHLSGCGDTTPDFEPPDTYDTSPLRVSIPIDEVRFLWTPVSAEYRLTQIAEACGLESELIAGGERLILESLETSIDVVDLTAKEFAAGFRGLDEVKQCFRLEAKNTAGDWVEIIYEIALFRANKQIQFDWDEVDGAILYRLTQTKGRYPLFAGPEAANVYASAADATMEFPGDVLGQRFPLSVLLFDWAESRFTLEACVDVDGDDVCDDWQFIGEQDTAGGAFGLIRNYTETDIYANSLRSQLAFGYDFALSEDGTTMAAGAIGETSVPPEQQELDLTIQPDSTLGNPPYIGRELQFAWDAVQDATQYRLVQIAGDTTVIDSEITVDQRFEISVDEDGNETEVEVSVYLEKIDILSPEFDSATLGFSLEAIIPDIGWQEIPLGVGFDWKYVSSVAVKNSGAVFVYDLETNGSVKVKSPLVDAGDQFGGAVALSDDGQILVVAAPGEDSDSAGIQAAPTLLLDNNDAFESGAVYVYLLTGNQWDLEAYIKAPVVDPAILNEDGFPEDFGDFFGWAIGLSGDGTTLAISARFEDSDSSGPENNDIANSGAVFVYRRAAGIWTQEAYLKASNLEDADAFGEAVTISADGNYLAVSTIFEDSDGSAPGSNTRVDSGAVYVFARDPATAEWSETAYLKASNAGAGDHFGQSVSFDAEANILAVGAPNEDQDIGGVVAVNSGDGSGNGNMGAAYLFERSGSGVDSVWQQKNFYFKASNQFPGAHFGQSVALSSGGDYLVVGAWDDASPSTGINGGQNSFGLPGAGAAYVFERQFDNNDMWRQIAFIKAPTPTSYLHFGSVLDMALNGEILGVAGTSLGSDNVITGRPGNVYLY